MALGAAVYCPAEHRMPTGSTRLDPSKAHRIEPAPPGPGPTNTITRAELVAILHAVEKYGAGRGIATDSLASLYAISKHMRCPHLHAEHPHRDLLQAIITAIGRTDGVVHLYKVPAHAGIVGNEVANDAAMAACEDYTAGEYRFCDPFDAMYWPAQRRQPDHTAQSQAAAPMHGQHPQGCCRT